MRCVTLLMLGWVLCIGSAQAQPIFFEDFQSGIPPTWTVLDLDGNTPASGVAQFTNGWIGSRDPNGINDTVAASTSWYNPPGTSNDWLITPPITLTGNNTLSWEARAGKPDYPDGYKVMLSTTNNSIASFNATLFATAAESNTNVYRSVDLQALGYANQTVYIAFVNNSTNKFILNIDDVMVSACPGPPTGTTGYTPDSNNVACIVQNVAYRENIQFEMPSTVSGATVNWVRIDSVTRMPCGIRYALDRPDATYSGGATGCITFSGLTSDPVGQYKPYVWATISVATFPTPLNIELAAATQAYGITGFGLYLRVKANPGAACPNINSGGPNLLPSGINCPYSPPQITITANPDTVCAGGNTTLTATVTHGTGTYGYFWTNGGTYPTQTYSPAGNTTYELTVVDGNSTVTETINVYIFPEVVANAGNDDTICTGESATLTASGGSSYVWSPATGLSCTNCASPVASPTVSTTYQVVAISAGGCTGTDSVRVIVSGAETASVTITASNDTICAGNNAYTFTATPTNGGTPTYQWTLNGNIVGANTSSIVMSNFAVGDQIRCNMTSSLSCVTNPAVQSNILVADSCGTIGIGSRQLSSMTVQVMPNPSTGKYHVSIQGNNELLTLEVMTVHGQRVWMSEVLTNGTLETAIDLTEQSAGIYILVVKGQDGMSIQKLYKAD